VPRFIAPVAVGTAKHFRERQKQRFGVDSAPLLIRSRLAVIAQVLAGPRSDPELLAIIFAVKVRVNDRVDRSARTRH
jgi:hypothetical protein